MAKIYKYQSMKTHYPEKVEKLLDWSDKINTLSVALFFIIF